MWGIYGQSWKDFFRHIVTKTSRKKTHFHLHKKAKTKYMETDFVCMRTHMNTKISRKALEKHM